MFRPILFLALVALTIARPNPSSLKTIASATVSKNSIKSPSQKLAEKNNSPSIASILESSAVSQGISQTENLSVNLPQGQDTDAALQYSQEVVQQQPAKVVPVVVKEEVANSPVQPVSVVEAHKVAPQSEKSEVAAPASLIHNEVVKPSTYSNVATGESALVVPVQPQVEPQAVPVQPHVVAQEFPVSHQPVVVENVEKVGNSPVQPHIAAEVVNVPNQATPEVNVQSAHVPVQPKVTNEVVHVPVQPQVAAVRQVQTAPFELENKPAVPLTNVVENQAPKVVDKTVSRNVETASVEQAVSKFVSPLVEAIPAAKPITTI